DCSPGRPADDKKLYNVRLWDVDAGKQLHKLGGHEGGGRSLTFSPDGRTLAVTGPFQRVRLWDTRTGKELARLGPPGESGGVAAFSPDGKTLAMSNGAG